MAGVANLWGCAQQYCCVERGFVEVLATQPDPTFLCHTGCEGSKTNIDSFYFDLQDNHCYPRCFDTYEPICYNGVIDPAVPLSTDPSQISPDTYAFTNQFCELHFPNPTQLYLIDRNVQGELLWPGWGFDLRSNECGSLAPELTAVCRGRGTVASSVNGPVCQVDTCGTVRSSFIAPVPAPFGAAVPGSSCYYDCWTGADRCIGWMYLGSGSVAFPGSSSSESSSNACAATMGPFGYQGSSYGDSPIDPIIV
jgi:hypothetical protein